MPKTVDQFMKAVNAKLQTLKITQGQAITAMERIQNALKKTEDKRSKT